MKPGRPHSLVDDFEYLVHRLRRRGAVQKVLPLDGQVPVPQVVREDPAVRGREQSRHPVVLLLVPLDGSQPGRQPVEDRRRDLGVVPVPRRQLVENRGERVPQEPASVTLPQVRERQLRQTQVMEEHRVGGLLLAAVHEDGIVGFKLPEVRSHLLRIRVQLRSPASMSQRLGEHLHHLLPVPSIRLEDARPAQRQEVSVPRLRVLRFQLQDVLPGLRGLGLQVEVEGQLGVLPMGLRVVRPGGAGRIEAVHGALEVDGLEVGVRVGHQGGVRAGVGAGNGQNEGGEGEGAQRGRERGGGAVFHGWPS